MTDIQATLTIDGLFSEDTARNTAEWLLGVEGVNDVEIDMEHHQALVQMDETEPPSEEELVKAVHAAGCDVQKIEIV
jgi:hypothetical protein